MKLRVLLASTLLAFGTVASSAPSLAEAPPPTSPPPANAAPTQADPHAHEEGDPATDPHAAPLPQDMANEDPSIPVGTILVHAVDPSGAPLPKAEVTLGILHNTVAQGESRKRVVATADASGIATFDHLELGSGIAYRAMILRDGATFSAPPFQLTPKSGVRAMVHAYPVTRELPPYVVSQFLLYAELKDDLIQIQQILKIYNFSPVAWVPDQVVLPLPPEFKAFTAQQGMTDVGLDAVDADGKKGAKLRGTFTPGEHELSYRWQLPYDGSAKVAFDVGLPPHLAAVRVMAPSAKNMQLEVENFPQARGTTDGMGQRALVTERQLRREDPPLTTLKVALTGLPTEGPGKLVATLLAACGVTVGLVLGARKPKARSPKLDRKRLLDELAELEDAHARGDVGPKTYERARRECIDRIAKTFADESPAKKAPRKAASPTTPPV